MEEVMKIISGIILISILIALALAVLVGIIVGIVIAINNIINDRKIRYLIFRNVRNYGYSSETETVYYSDDGDWTKDISKAHPFKTFEEADYINALLGSGCYCIQKTTTDALKEVSMRNVQQDIKRR